jgi:phosphosulfolactate synthase
MDSIFLDLPRRSAKPRPDGLTMVIDNGLPHGWFVDAVTMNAPYIDVVKFGWGTAIVTPDIERKFEVLRNLDIPYYFGGTLFEKFVAQNRFESFMTLCRLCGCTMVEVSNGTITLSNDDKADYISRCAQEFSVLSEVGFKDQGRSEAMGAGEWAQAIAQDLAAGAQRVITEARESGRSGICDANGRPRRDLVDAILASGIDPAQLIFEAPNKDLQTYWITLLGSNVNLGNIAPGDVVGLETLRLGLRSDTLEFFERVRSVA